MVISDACKATAELVQDMTQDCGEEIYYFGGLLDLSPSRHRLAGYELGLHRAGLEATSDRVRHRDYQPSSGYQLMSELVDRNWGAEGAFYRLFHPAGGGAALPQRGGTDGDRHAPVYLRRSRSVRLHPHAHRFRGPGLPGPGPAAFEMMQQLIAGNPPAQTAQVINPRCAGAAAARHTASLFL